MQNRSGNRTDFTDPATGSYLRVDWTDTPGDSAQADWERQSDAFGAKQQNYQEVGISPTTFAGSTNASLWEYRYTAGGADLHAYNLGFVLPTRGTASPSTSRPARTGGRRASRCGTSSRSGSRPRRSRR